MKKIFVLFAGLIAFSGCYNDKADQLYPKAATGGGGCDTTNVTYAANVQPVMQQSCATGGCHDATTKQSGYDLSSYASVKQAADNGELIGCITWASGFSPMPKNMAKLDDCTINKISRWVRLGAMNN